MGAPTSTPPPPPGPRSAPTKGCLVKRSEEKLNFQRNPMDNLHNSYESSARAEAGQTISYLLYKAPDGNKNSSRWGASAVKWYKVQVPSSGYVNEVNSCKVDEGGAGKWKGKQGSQVLGHQNELQSEGLKRTASRGRAGSGQEPRWPPPGSPPLGDTVGGHCADKAGSAVNGIGPAAPPQPTGDRGPHQGERGSCVSTANSAPPTAPFREGGGPGRRDSVLLPALRETHVVQSGDPRAALRAEGPALEVQVHDFQMPVPDYPPLRGSAGDTVDGEEKDGLPESHPEEGPPAGLHPRAGGHGLNMPFSLKRSWDSLNEAVATEALSVGFKEEDAAQAVPGVDSRTGWEDAPGSTADGSGDAVDEDAAVAEALAALEAATAGEDAEEAD